jgi:hypothetical protein
MVIPSVDHVVEPLAHQLKRSDGDLQTRHDLAFSPSSLLNGRGSSGLSELDDKLAVESTQTVERHRTHSSWSGQGAGAAYAP